MNPHFNQGQSTPVAIVGGGPVGLALALGLSRHGVRSVVLERQPATSEYSKAPAIHVRSREVFRQWGVEDRLLEAGVLKRTLTLHAPEPGHRPLVSIDFSELEEEVDRPGLLILEQSRTEKLLLDAVSELGLCDVRFGAEVVALSQGREGVRLTVREGGREVRLDAELVVGCDGASSFVRSALSLPFEGITYSVRPMLADVRVDDERDTLPWPRTRNGSTGITTAVRLDPGLWRLIRLERGKATEKDDVPDAEVGERVDEVLGEGPFEVVWASRFRIHRRASPRFRVGRVLLAGDAAHVHSPAGGLGMNAGIQDAHNLAWKIARVLGGGDANRLLDSYEVERRAVVVETVSRFTDVITRVFLQTPTALRDGAFFLFRSMLEVPRLRRGYLRRATMIDLDYPTSPIVAPSARAAGIRLPNPRLRAPDASSIRLYDLLSPRPTLLELGGRPLTSRDPRTDGGRREIPSEMANDVIRIGPGGYEEPAGILSELLGGASGVIVVRPDAHIAFAGDRLDEVGRVTRDALGWRGSSTTPADATP